MAQMRVHSPPAKPLMIFDGECRFCAYWIRRWQSATAGRVEYLPAQDAQVSARFPEVPRESFAQSVQLIEPEGLVYSGAEAVFRSLAKNPRWQLWWRLYQKLPGFAPITEWAYRLVANHRTFFSKLTTLFFPESAQC